MIVKCSHCHQMFPEKNFDAHLCDRPLEDCKIIQVSDIFDGSYKNKKRLNGWGIDGVLYTFEIVPRKAIPLMEPLSRRKVTAHRWRDETDDKETEPYAGTVEGGSTSALRGVGWCWRRNNPNQC
jgi:hypothetical protein